MNPSTPAPLRNQNRFGLAWTKVPKIFPPHRLLLVLYCLLVGFSNAPASAATGLTMAWTNNILTITGPDMPGERVEVWYLEAFCRTGSTKRNWSQTTIPHKTELISAQKDGKRLQLRTRVEPDVEVQHTLQAGEDDVEFRLSLKNHGSQFADVDWFQPCIRVGRFTGRDQKTYVPRSFIFTERGLTTLDQTKRTEEAIYRGGQVYVPAGINLEDVNPRPISPEKPVNGLIGCFSSDGKYLLATAWDHTQELFQGVIICIHNDPRVGGLQAGETKTLRGKLYFLKNDPKLLLERYEQDFPRVRP
ncbi:MAG: hypothetical protein HY735_16115 [Verrucomicrobia bacterium]|nr:hypothetical protein [Verrucomicrobiota bacterium]